MNKLQLTNLGLNSQSGAIDREEQKSIRGGDRFNDGKLDSSEKAFIGIVTRAVGTRPNDFPKFSDPEWNQDIKEDYPDIYNSFLPS